MRTIFRISFFAFLLILGSFSVAQAQKYAHTNLGNLLAELPEVKAADAELETFSTQQTKKGEEMVKAFQAKVANAQTQIDGGGWSPARIQEEQTKLAQEEQKIRQYEQEVVAAIQQKRQELLGPILVKIESTIKTIAEEEGYVMVFDTGIVNAILFAKESEDITEKVRAKL